MNSVKTLLTKQTLIMGLAFIVSSGLKAEVANTNRYDLVTNIEQQNGMESIRQSLKAKNNCDELAVGPTYESFLENVVNAREMLDTKQLKYDDKVEELKNYCTSYFKLDDVKALWGQTGKSLAPSSSPALKERQTIFQLGFQGEQRLVNSCKAFLADPTRLMAVSNDINHLLYLYGQDHLKSNLWLRVKGYDSRICMKESHTIPKGKTSDGQPLMQLIELDPERTFYQTK